MGMGMFSRDSRNDDKARRDAAAATATQRAPAVAPATPAAAPTAAAPAATPAAPAGLASETGSKLTVGPNIKLKSAEITDCDTLVVEGHVDGTVASLGIVIAQTGTLNGTAAIDNAEIRGEFKGELTVRKRLMICATGKVTGKIAYGKLVIEEGGELVGEIQAMHGSGVASPLDPAALRTGTSALPHAGVPARH